MSIASTLFVRVVNADRGRGHMLLVGWDAKVVQATAVQLITLSAVTRTLLDSTIARVKATYSASEVRDVTADGIKRQLRALFGEPKDGEAKTEEAAA
jgi:hypothetical protein